MGNRLIVLVGPTAVGKTELALALAERLNGEIVSADSRLFYRGMDIGTAKPTREERARVPHHLIDVTDPDETWSLAVFQQEARKAIEGIQSRGKLPLLVGGTGQYVRAVIQGWSVPAVEPDPRLRGELEKLAQAWGKEWLFERLQSLDPEAAANIDLRNVRRVVRALEVILTTGRKFSAQRIQGEGRYHTLMIGLKRPRQELYGRIDARIEAMFQAGLLEEVRGLLARGYGPELPSMSGIGYRECVQVLQGQTTIEEAKTQMRRLTRAFVRRQANWFKETDPEIHWMDAGDPGLPDRVVTLVKRNTSENN